jgi:hypothetical protein
MSYLIKMLSATFSAAIQLLTLVKSTVAQFPTEPIGLKVLESRFGEGITITYKEVQYRFILIGHSGSTDYSNRTLSVRLGQASSHMLDISISLPELQTWAKDKATPLTVY